MAQNTAPKKRETTSVFQQKEVFLYKNKSPLRIVSRAETTPNFLYLVVICFIFIFAAWKGLDFLELNEDGEVVLSAARQEKLDKGLEDLEEAEQYVLLVIVPGLYPCYSCPNSTTIPLITGEVWKYGVTTKGQNGRYPNGLPALGLVYRKQLISTLQNCLQEERRKIFNYALLPENIKRTTPIIRPPGNKQDN